MMIRGFVLVILWATLVSCQADDSTAPLPPSAAAQDDDDGLLVWENLSVRVRTAALLPGNNNNDMVLLHPTSGRVPAGHLCGILGSSGAGKSTFLRALAGLSHDMYKVDGHVAMVHTAAAASNDDDDHVIYQGLLTHQVAFLDQHDNFFSGLTVEETLQLAAFLELPALPVDVRHSLVETQLTQLGLGEAAHRKVGEPGQGLSGGERRRLAVAREVLTDKQIVLADEATSGLDTALARKVMECIQQVARKRGIPALCSLHAPRSAIWKLLDHVILIGRGGYVCYSGPRKDCLPYFKRLGYVCPSETNPAEFLLDLVSVDSTADQARVEELASAFSQFQQQQQSTNQGKRDFSASRGTIEWGDPPRPGKTPSLGPIHVLRRFGAIVRRSWRQNIRNTHIHVVRFAASVVNAVLLAGIFPSVAPGKPPSPSSVADRVALLTFGAINMAFMAFMKTITLIAEERPVVEREQSRGQYSALEYIVAKAITELPMDSFFAAVFTTVLKRVSGLRIAWKHVTATFSLLTTAGASLGLALGCWSTNADLTKTASVPVMVLLMVVGVINPSGVDPNRSPPLVVQWLKKLSPFAYAVEALCLGEYPGMTFPESNGVFSRVRDLPKMGGLALVQNGDQVIEALGLTETSYGHAMRQLGFLSGGFTFMSWIGLMVQHWLPKLRKRWSTYRQWTKRAVSSSAGAVSELSSEERTTVRVPAMAAAF